MLLLFLVGVTTLEFIRNSFLPHSVTKKQQNNNAYI